MNFPKKTAVLASIIFLSLSFFIFGQNSSSALQADSENQAEVSEKPDLHGIELCQNLLSILKKEKLHPSIQSLVNSGENDFPYNLVIENSRSDETCRLIFNFNMKEAWQYSDLIIQLADLLKEQDFNSTILLAYEENLYFMDYPLPNSTSVFINTIDNNDNNIVYNINLNRSQNTVISGTRGFASPSWMIKQVYESFNTQNIEFQFPFIYISQLSKFRFEMNRTLQTFLQNDISAITVNFSKNQAESDDIFKVLSFLANDFVNSKDSLNDYHSMMLNIFGKNIWLSEATILKIVVIFILISLAFLFILSYINFNLKNQAWIELKNNWYILIVTYVLSVLGCYAGKGIFYLFYRHSFEAASVFGILILELAFALTFTSAFFITEMFIHKKRYSGKSICLLLMLITFINQFIFCFADVSLFPIFFLIFIFSIFCFIFDKHWVHIIFLLLTVGIFVVYATILMKNSDPSTLRMFLITSKSLPFVFSLIMIPLNMMWFCIITKLRIRFEKTKVSVITIGASYAVTLLFILLLNIFYFSKIKLDSEFNHIIPADDLQDKVTLSYKDQNIFGEIIRTVRYHTDEKTAIVRITIEGTDSNPVLYSEYDYVILSPKKIAVSIPSYPGNDIVFSYGAAQGKSIITSDSVIASDNKNEFLKITNTVQAE